MQTYEYIGQYGVTDLKFEYPFEGEWSQYVGDIPIEEYNKDPKGYARRISKENKLYLDILKANGKYGSNFTCKITCNTLPLFDDIKHPSDAKPLEVYSMYFIDQSKFFGKPNIQIVKR